MGTWSDDNLIRAIREVRAEKRIEAARTLADHLQREGDLMQASVLLYEVIPELEGWQQQWMRVLSSSDTRRVVEDEQGNAWIAVPLTELRIGEVTLPFKPVHGA